MSVRPHAMEHQSQHHFHKRYSQLLCESKCEILDMQEKHTSVISYSSLKTQKNSGIL